MGIILYELLTFSIPFSEESTETLCLEILSKDLDFSKIKILKSLGEDCIDLLSMLLKRNPDERISARDALNHSWFNS